MTQELTVTNSVYGPLKARNASFSSANSLGINVTITLIITILTGLVTALSGCQAIREARQDVRPLVMRDVPAQRLAYRLEPDVPLSSEIANPENSEKLEAVQADFTTRRIEDALLRTVLSPDKQRVLALYGNDNEPSSAFRIDLYAADGKFLRNLTPPDLSCLFPETVAWSGDGNYITFIARKSVRPSPTPTPPILDPEEIPEAVPSPSVAPMFRPVAVFNTEQIYICNRDGNDLKPLTTRDGLIYFYFSWAPDSHALVALACKENEWEAREREYRLPAGRPRLITVDGKERLLDDDLTEALPVWSTDASKVASAFESDVAVYDANTNQPTQARIHLREGLIKASRDYEARQATGKAKEEGKAPATSPDSLPASFNPIVRLEWPSPEKLYVKTAYVRVMPYETINTFQRWHLVMLSPQAAVLK